MSSFSLLLCCCFILLPESKRGIVVFANGAKGDQLYEKIIEGAFDVGKEIINRMK